MEQPQSYNFGNSGPPALAGRINAYVLHLYGSEPNLKMCKQRAAQRFGVSYATVQRAWSSRGKQQQMGEISAGEFVEFIRMRLQNNWIVPNTSVVEIAKTEYKSLSEGM